MFSVIELIGGLLTGSFAILADALHDFGDSLALLASALAERMAKRAPDEKRTFGLQRFSLTAAIVNAIVLFIGSAAILYHAVPRLFDPGDVHGPGMVALAVLGIAVNGFGAMKLHHGHSLNEKVLTWHLLEDVFGWVAVLFGGIAIWIWDLPILDPILTIVFILLVLWNVFKRLREGLHLAHQGVPLGIDLKELTLKMEAVKDVLMVHDIHLWSLDGENHVFTGHVMVHTDALPKSPEIIAKLREILKDEGIHHATLEAETPASCHGIECPTFKGVL